MQRTIIYRDADGKTQHHTCDQYGTSTAIAVIQRCGGKVLGITPRHDATNLPVGSMGDCGACGQPRILHDAICVGR